MTVVKISPSMLSADFACLKGAIDSVKDAEMLHLDVMDGHFVPNITFGPCVISKIRPCTDQIFDTHLMIEKPIRYIDDFVDAGSDYITVHAESHRDVDDMINTLEAIKETGTGTGLSINPKTSWRGMEDIIGMVDMVLVMTVEPGFGGQGFIPEVIPKIREIRDHLDDIGASTEISVDGGISPQTAPEVVLAGADILVAGSAIFRGDPSENLEKLRRATLL